MRMPISRFNHLIEFGTTDTVDTDTLEGSEEVFVPKQTLHFAYYQRSQTQQYQLLGTDLEHTIVIAVRSQYHVDDTQLARIKGDEKQTTYKVMSISRGEAHSPINYDLITLKDIKKIGGSNG